MDNQQASANHPRVTVLTSTYNRPDYLKDAVASIVAQELESWEMILINDGGVDVQPVVKEFNDNRITYINRKKNRGKAACLNLGLSRARGDYIAYLDDDDIWYPNHLSELTAALDENPDLAAVYSDLYEVQFVADPDSNRRYPLNKFIALGRDYNRDFMFVFNHTLHVSLMHRRDLALAAKGYDPKVRIMIDWDITRKLSFYGDFKYVPKVTGEYYVPIGKSDRISFLGRIDSRKYALNLRRIKADLPPEPWPKVKKVAVILPVDQWDEEFKNYIDTMMDRLAHPVIFVFVNNQPGLTEGECRKALKETGEFSNIRILFPPSPLSPEQACRMGAESTDAPYLYLPGKNADLTLDQRLLPALYILENSDHKALKWDLESEKEGPFDLLVERSLFLRASGVDEIKPEIVNPLFLPPSFAFDLSVQKAGQNHRNGNFKEALRQIQEASAIKKGGSGSQYLADVYSKICFDLKQYDEAEVMCRELVERGYGADNWIRLGKILSLKGRFEEALEAFENGLAQIGLSEDDLESPVFPIVLPMELFAFTAMYGMADCLLNLDRLMEASRYLRLSSRLRADSHLPHLGFGRLFLKVGHLKNAARALKAANELAPGDPAVLSCSGMLMEARRRIPQAFDFYEKAFAAEPTNEATMEALVRTGRRINAFARLHELLTVFLGHRPGHLEGIFQMARICRDIGDLEKARELVDRGLALNPDHEGLKSFL